MVVGRRLISLPGASVSERYCVRIEKDTLVFSAAHFITFAGNICERLHGHNYRVAAEVAGPLDENHYVIDFIALRDSLAAIVARLDHRVLLPTTHPAIHVEATSSAAYGDEVTASFENRRWVFPRGDCILLPVANTTAELLARHIAGELLAELGHRGIARPASVMIEVDECYGQLGRYELTADV
jgi:6-pyruvoyltetrahydropterin/6-carboxytetrahydropterin synthase